MRAAARAAAAALALTPTPALAHAPLAGAGSFYAGLLHPLLALEHVLPLLAVGLLAGQARREAGLWAALACAAAAVAGGLLALQDIELEGAAPALTGATVLVGVLVAADRRLSAGALLLAAAVVGCALGYLQASEDRSLPFIAGIATAITVLLLYATALVGRIEAPWGRIAVRVAGSWIAAIDTMLLGLALR